MNAYAFRALAIATTLIVSDRALAATTVSYSGVVTGGFAPSKHVIAATFAPSFDPATYAFVYGDAAGNLDPNAFNLAIADGNLFPIGDGVAAALDGSFAASGDTDASLGTPIWLFAFDDASRNSVFQAIVTSSASNWKVTAPSTAIVATEADYFYVGSPTASGIEIASIPIPEPFSGAIVAGGSLAAAARRRRA